MNWRLILAASLGAVTLACTPEPADDDAYDRVMSYDTTSARLARGSDTLQLRLELALTGEQKTMGLMERRQLADDAGMLFVYDSTQAADAGFWMYRTRIPLDIAFLDSAGVIRSIRSMVPCPTTIAEGCPTYAPGTPYRYALEVNAGYFARNAVGLGHTLVLQDLPSKSAAGTSPSPR